MAKPLASKTCPQCQHALGPQAVLCVNCGTNLRTGRRLSKTVVDPDTQAKTLAGFKWTQKGAAVALIAGLLAPVLLLMGLFANASILASTAIWVLWAMLLLSLAAVGLCFQTPKSVGRRLGLQLAAVFWIGSLVQALTHPLAGADLLTVVALLLCGQICFMMFLRGLSDHLAFEGLNQQADQVIWLLVAAVICLFGNFPFKLMGVGFSSMNRIGLIALCVILIWGWKYLTFTWDLNRCLAHRIKEGRLD